MDFRLGCFWHFTLSFAHRLQAPEKHWPGFSAQLSCITLRIVFFVFVKSDYFAHAASAIFHRSLVALGGISLLLAAMFLPVGAFFWIRPALWPGKISYGIYL
jgi:peptidoglycan/LPS O-acetylase OafA/YrhL